MEDKDPIKKLFEDAPKLNGIPMIDAKEFEKELLSKKVIPIYKYIDAITGESYKEIPED